MGAAAKVSEMESGRRQALKRQIAALEAADEELGPPRDKHEQQIKGRLRSKIRRLKWQLNQGRLF